MRRRSVKRQQLQQQLHREWRRDSSSCTCVLWQQLPRLRQRCVTCGDRYANRCPPFIVEVGVFVRFVTIINRKTLYSCMLATSGCLNVSTATILCVRFSCSLKSAYRTTKFGAINRHGNGWGHGRRSLWDRGDTSLPIFGPGDTITNVPPPNI